MKNLEIPAIRENIFLEKQRFLKIYIFKQRVGIKGTNIFKRKWKELSKKDKRFAIFSENILQNWKYLLSRIKKSRFWK